MKSQRICLQVLLLAVSWAAITALDTADEPAKRNPLLKHLDFDVRGMYSEAQKIFDVNTQLLHLHPNDEPTGNSHWDKLGLELQMEGVTKMIRAVGVNGMLDVLELIEPACHTEAHQVGRAATHLTQDIQLLLNACQDRCRHGCFHGVILGLVVDSYQGVYDDLSREEQMEHMKDVFQSFCSRGHGGDQLAIGACAHGVGHAVALAAGHDMMDGMNLCLQTFEGVPGLQHRCGTGVGMQLKERVKDPVKECGNLPLPAGCFEYAWLTRPKLQASSHYRNNEEYLKEIVEWGKATIHSCMVLDSTVRQEACVYGAMSTISGDFMRGKRRFEEYGARDIDYYMKYTIKYGSRNLCADINPALQKACIFGWLRYSLQVDKESPSIICGGLSKEKKNTMHKKKCLEISSKYVENADAEEMHFLIIQP